MIELEANINTSMATSEATSKDSVSPGERVPRSIRTQAPSSIFQLDGITDVSAGAQETTPLESASTRGAEEASRSMRRTPAEKVRIVYAFTLPF